MSDAMKGRILRSALVAGTAALVAGVIALAFLPKVSKPLAMTAGQTVPLSVFSAPSHIPAGEQWMFVGSFQDLPDDLVASPATAGVTVLETQKISKKAVGVRLNASLGAFGKLLRVSSVSTGAEADLDVYQGPIPEYRSADGNFTSEDLVNGSLVVTGKYFMYGYYPAGESPLAALRIHNRATGTWYRHEHAIKRASEANDVKVPVPPYFVEVNVLETLPDTDGNGVPDFADVEETKPAVPEQLGVEVVPQANVIDIVAVDEAGVASWRTLNVYSTCTPAE